MNVIFIMNDSFRRDHLGCCGNAHIHTPCLDHFAAEAALFEQCTIASYPTVPNRWDLVTGRYGFPFRGWQPLAPETVERIHDIVKSRKKPDKVIEAAVYEYV